MDIRIVLWQLRKEVKKRENVYQRLRKKHKILEQFKSFRDLEEFLHQRDDTDYVRKDNVILTLLSEYRATRYKNSLSPFFILLFEPALKRIFYLYEKRLTYYLEVNTSDLVSQILSFFLEELKKPLPKEKVFSKVTGRLKNKVRNYFYNLLIGTKAEIEYQHALGEKMPSPISLGVILRFLNRLQRRKVITSTQKRIILATIAYKQPLKDLSNVLDLTPQNIRQKKYRALKAIKKYLKAKKIDWHELLDKDS